MTEHLAKGHMAQPGMGASQSRLATGLDRMARGWLSRSARADFTGW